MRRWRFVAVLAGLVLAGGGASRLPWARAQGSPPPGRSEVAAFTGGGGSWAWIERAGERTTVHVGGRGRSFVLAEGTGWTDLAVEGPTCWLLAAGRGALQRLPLSPGQQAEEVLTGLRNAGALAAAPGRVFWLEGAPAASPLGAFVPIAGPSLRLRMREASGRVVTLGSWPAAVVAPEAGDVVAVTRDAVVVRVRWRHSTEFVSFPQVPGEPVRLAIEPGRQHGVLHRGELYWTSRSDEAPPQTEITRVLRPGRGAPETVAEWLPPGGRLLSLRGGLYYAGRALYRVPDRLEPAPAVAALPDLARFATDGESVLRLDGAAPSVAWPEGR